MTTKIIKDRVIYHDTRAEFIDFVINKTERLTSALYLVSDLINSTEPLKTSLREKGIEMLSDICVLADFTKENKDDVFLKIMTGISALTSLLRVASVGGFISEMNSNILQKEYVNLASFFESRRQSFGRHIGKEILFNDDFFEGGEWRCISAGAPNDKRQTKGQDNLYKTSNAEGGLSESGENVKNNIHQTQKNEAKKEKNNNENVVQEDRKKTIVQLIKDANGNVNIKDISMHIRGCSEKTLQRDLIALMQKGILKKTGERRWSRYFLA